MARKTKKVNGIENSSDGDSSADEFDLQEILNRCWTVKDRETAIRKLAEEASNGTVAIIKLLLEYTYGRPSEKYEPDFSTPAIPIDFDEAIERIYGNGNQNIQDAGDKRN